MKLVFAVYIALGDYLPFPALDHDENSPEPYLPYLISLNTERLVPSRQKRPPSIPGYPTRFALPYPPKKSI